MTNTTFAFYHNTEVQFGAGMVNKTGEIVKEVYLDILKKAYSYGQK